MEYWPSYQFSPVTEDKSIGQNFLRNSTLLNISNQIVALLKLSRLRMNYGFWNVLPKVKNMGLEQN